MWMTRSVNSSRHSSDSTLRPALIIVSSDHGEEFWEHGGFEHGHALNNEVIGVPLIIKPPRTSAAAPYEAKRIATPVSITSIRSTMLEVAQVPAASSTLPLGESLVPYWTSASFERSEAPIVSGALKYFGQQLSLLRGSYKYIRHLEDGREELYDLVVDPDESENLASLEPDLTLELSEALDREVDEGRRIAKSSESAKALPRSTWTKKQSVSCALWATSSSRDPRGLSARSNLDHGEPNRGTNRGTRSM